MTRTKRVVLAIAAGAALLPLAGCYDDAYGPPPPRHYRPPPPPLYYAPPPPPRYYAPPPPPPGEYYPEREYRPAPGYDRPLTRADSVYRGRDGRYYCHRSDGSTGTVVGAVAGGALGAILGGGGALGTLLGAGGGALLGRSIDQNEIHCR